MAFKLTNSPLKNIDSTKNRDNARSIEEAKAAKAEIEGQGDITQSASQIGKSSQLDNIENKLTELSESFSKSQEPEKQYEMGIRGNMERYRDFKDEGGEGSFNQFLRDNRRAGESWADPSNMMRGGLSRMFGGGAFFKKKKY